MANLLVVIQISGCYQIYCRPTHAKFEETMLFHKSARHIPLRDRFICLYFYYQYLHSSCNSCCCSNAFFSEILCPSVSVVPSIAYLKAGRMPRDTKLRHSMQLLNCVMLYWVALVGAVRLIIEDIKTHKFFNE